MTRNDVQALRDQAARYRRMRADLDDQKTKDILESLAAECDAKAADAEQQKQSSMLGTKNPT